MTDRHRLWLRWAVALLVTAIIGVQIPWVVEIFKSTEPDYTSVPTLTHDQYEADLAYVRGRLNAPIGNDPVDYYRTYADIARFERPFDKMLAQNTDARMLAGRYGLAGNMSGAVIEMQNRYSERFGMNAMAQAIQAHPELERRIHAESALGLGTHMDGSVLWDLFWRAWVSAGLLAMMLFMARLKQERLLIWTEFHRIFLYAVVWPFGIFKYPRFIDPRKQIKQAYQFVAGLIAATLSVAAAGVAAAQTAPEGDDTGTSGNVRVLSASDLPKVRDYQLNGSVTLMSQKVTGNGTVVHPGATLSFDTSVTYTSGLGFDFSGTRALSGASGSDENDYAVSYTRGHVTVSLNYYDIQPIGRAMGGDMIAPVVQITEPLGHGFTGTVRGEYDFLTAGPPGRDGYIISAGVSRSDMINHSLRLDQGLSFAYSDGPFHQDEGLVARYEAGVSTPVTERVRFNWFKFKLFAPILGANDRHPTWSASSGLSFAF